MNPFPFPMTTHLFPRAAGRLGALVLAALVAGAVFAQSPAPSAAKPDGGALAPLAWLEGCWRGSAGDIEFREQWMPLRGNLLIGVSQTVARDNTQDYEYLRLEARPDGVYYVAMQEGRKESAFRLSEQSVDRAEGRNDEIFIFVNAALEFPQKITYRRASEGWLYAVVEGKSKGVDRQVTYPMRRIGCESGEFIRR